MPRSRKPKAPEPVTHPERGGMRRTYGPFTEGDIRGKHQIFAMLDPVRMAQEIDSAVARRAQRHRVGMRDAGISRHQAALLEARQRDAGTLKNPQVGASTKGYIEDNALPGQAPGLIKLAQSGVDVSDSLARGPGGRQYFGQGVRGPMESIAMVTANNPGVRHAGLGALAAGTTVASGALLTEGAQQLLALMDYMGGQQESEIRAAQSPLV